MKYLTGSLCYYIPCSEDSEGSWGLPKEDWSDDKLEFAESDDSILKDWGIETDKIIPYHDEFTLYNVATHTRAYLDSLIAGKFLELENVFNDCIATPKCRYTIFRTVLYKLRNLPNYKQIYDFMAAEFGNAWIGFVYDNLGGNNAESIST